MRVVRWFNSVSLERLFLTPPVYEELLNGIDETSEDNPTRQHVWLEETRKQYKWLDLPEGKSVIMTEAMAQMLVEHRGNIPRKYYPDFRIGMIAINNGMKVATRNEKDFRDLGIPFINPFRYRG